MKPLPRKNDTASVYGLGRSGRALITHLVKTGVRVYAFDDAEREALGDLPLWLSSLGVPLFAGGQGEARGDFVFRTPSMRPDHPRLCRAALRGATVMGEVEYFASLCPSPIYAVTGSDGKTTTATLLSALLSSAGKRVYFGGNVGKSLLPFLDEMTENDVCVLELSSFQLMDMECPVDTGIVTNLSPNHLDWHTGMAEYTAAKGRLLRMARRRVLPLGLFDGEEALRFSLDGQADFALCGDTLTGFGIPLCRTSDVRLEGRHNLANLLAAAAGAAPLVTPHTVREVARRFGGVPHRMETVAVKGGVRYVNSSIDTTPSRTAATLAAQSGQGRTLLLLGGRGKSLPAAPLTEALRGKDVLCFLFGEARESLAAAVRAAGCPCALFARMEDAFYAAHAASRAGDTLLLSPAATSYDTFPDYAARGECFRALVAELRE